MRGKVNSWTCWLLLLKWNPKTPERTSMSASLQPQVSFTRMNLFPLPPKRGPGRPPTLPIREDLLAGRQLLQKATGLFRRNLPVEQRTQQRTPENGPPPILFGTGFAHLTAPRARGVALFS